MSETREATEVRPVEVGDVFAYSWGYDQTNIDYYAVRSVSKSGKTVMVQECQSVLMEDDGCGSDYVVPAPDLPRMRELYEDTYLEDGPPYYRREHVGSVEYPTIRKQVQYSAWDSRNEPTLRFDHGIGRRVEFGQMSRRTSTGWGH